MISPGFRGGLPTVCQGFHAVPCSELLTRSVTKAGIEMSLEKGFEKQGREVEGLGAELQTVVARSPTPRVFHTPLRGTLWRVLLAARGKLSRARLPLRGRGPNALVHALREPGPHRLPGRSTFHGGG